jgi:MFS superfamily sulfate permease-like transporter
MVLAAFIFMHPMASLTGGRERKRGEPMPFELPDWAVFYEFSSPLFFGAAEQAFAALDRAAREHKEASVIIIDFTFGWLHDRRIGMVLSGMHPAVYRPLRKAE